MTAILFLLRHRGKDVRGAEQRPIINLVMISTSEIKTAVLIDEAKLTEGANVVHEAFGLGK